MATKKAQVNSKLLELVAATPPRNPAVTAADKIFLRGLIRRGYTEEEVISLAIKSGLKVNPKDLVVKKREQKEEKFTAGTAGTAAR